MTNNPGSKLKDWVELTKFRIMIPVSLTGFTGYFIFDPIFSSRIIFTSLGILLMSISASVLNQIQEAEPDSKMLRTCDRPLPSKRISMQSATIFFLFNLIAGVAVIYLAGNLKAALIGLITILWYNGIYTYSKKITAFAVVPGALTGALPPLIGWVAAGGGIWEKPIIFVEFVIFTGQIPHFWLLILRYGEEYKKAGFPTLIDIFTVTQIKRITFSWVVASVFAALFLCSFEIIQSQLLIGILLVASIYIIWQFLNLVKVDTNKINLRSYSIILDLYFLIILLLLITDRVTG